MSSSNNASGGGQRNLQSIDVKRIAEVDVGNESAPQIRTDTELRTGSDIPDVFSDYVNTIAVMRDKSEVSAGVFNQNSSMESRLDQLRGTTLAEKEFREEAAEVAVELNDQMDSISAPTGTLFTCQVAISDPMVNDGEELDTVVLLKMDPEAMRRLAREDDELDELDRSEVYPEASEIQKAAVYPLFNTGAYGRSGDVKIYQSSGSQYFTNFLQCSAIGSSLDQFKSLAGYISEVRRENGQTGVQTSDIAEMIDVAERNGGTAETSEFATALESVLPENKSQAEIESELTGRGIREIDVENGTLPQSFKYLSEVGGEAISVKVPVGLDGQVSVTEQNGDYVIRIEADDYQKEVSGR